VTRDRARKKAIRARMAVSGEPYSVAARTLAAAEPAIDAEAVRELIVRVNRTMAASSARIEVRVDNEIILAERPERRRPGPAGRLARAAWKGIASTGYATRLRDMFLHHVAEGFIEPAAGRYMIDWGGSAEMGVDGKRFSGQSGEPLQPRLQNHRVPAPSVSDEPLGLLMQLQSATDARYTGDDTVRGTPCQVLAVLAGPAELTVWIDGAHIRRIESAEHASGQYSSVTKRLTIELWDFGVAIDSLDWSHLPSFRAPG
jgi:hypothetical protein